MFPETVAPEGIPPSPRALPSPLGPRGLLCRDDAGDLSRWKPAEKDPYAPAASLPTPAGTLRRPPPLERALPRPRAAYGGPYDRRGFILRVRSNSRKTESLTLHETADTSEILSVTNSVSRKMAQQSQKFDLKTRTDRLTHNFETFIYGSFSLLFFLSI